MRDYENVGADIVLLKLGAAISLRYADLYRLLVARKFNAVCDFTGDFAGLVLLVARAAGIKTRIAFYRGSQYQFRRTLLRIRFAQLLNWFVRTSATRVLSNSLVALDRFHPGWADKPDRYRVIRNPAPCPEPQLASDREELRREAGIPDDAFVITHVGRVSPAKNHDVILQIIRLVITKHSHVWAVLIGSGTREAAKMYPLGPDAHRVITFEHRSDVVEFLQASDAFLFPSLNEGMPNAMVEAMAAGCPVLASDIPSIREVFPPSYRTSLFAPTDVLGAVERVGRLIAHPDPGYGAHLQAWTRKHFATEATLGAFCDELIK
jgi:glycosyltransferase involved in cell wall biosynthesis